MSEWISVDDKIPEPEVSNNFGTSRYVLVLNEYGDMVTAWYQHECDYQVERNNNKGYHIGFHSSLPQSDDDIINSITHWMEKPEPPK
jgi:hypothetical protein